MRQKEIEELAKLKEGFEKQSPDVDASVGLVFLHKLLDSNTSDLEFIDTQYARYKKDFVDTSVILAELDEKKEEQTKDANWLKYRYWVLMSFSPEAIKIDHSGTSASNSMYKIVQILFRAICIIRE